MNMFYLLDGIDICGDLSMVWTIFGYIILAIQIVVPLLLIVSGMITMAQAVMQKDEKKIKEAQSLLVKKLIAAVICFLIIAVTKMVVRLVANDSWVGCAKCALSPFEEGCGFEKANINTGQGDKGTRPEGTVPGANGGMIYVPGLFD